MKKVAPAERFAPTRLLAGGGSEYERCLLQAAAMDVMPPDTPERLGRALSASRAASAAAPAAPRAPAATTLRAGSTLAGRLARLGAIGGVGGLALAGWWLASHEPGADVPVIANASPVVAPASASASASAPAPAPASAVAPAPAPTPLTLPVPSTVAVAANAEPAAAVRSLGPARVDGAAPARPSARGGLLEEARLLDAARAALREGKSAPARRVLAEYRARFPRGELVLEAGVLNSERLLLDGDTEQAAVLARELLVLSGAGRYRSRLEQLLRRAHGLGVAAVDVDAVDVAALGVGTVDVDAARSSEGSNRAGSHMEGGRKP